MKAIQNTQTSVYLLAENEEEQQILESLREIIASRLYVAFHADPSKEKGKLISLIIGD